MAGEAEKINSLFSRQVGISILRKFSDYSIRLKFKNNGGRFNIEAKKLFKTKLSIKC